MSRWWLLILPVVALAVALAAWSLRAGEPDALVIYCAHDRLYSEPVLREFERETGIPLRIVFDSEATKSLGLIERLIREADDPVCDVFWNNELFGTADLARRGLLAGYRGPGWERMPEAFRDPAGRWVGFGARLRVWIVNTERMPVSAEAVAAALERPELDHVAMAKPLYGTTLTHYTVLWDRWGAERLAAWHDELRARGLREVAGNGPSKQLVADGVCALAWTDTDDAFVGQDAGAPVAMLPVRLSDGATICIPNTVGILRGSERRAAAQRLVDYLLSEATELRLAHGRARQVPLGPIDAARLPEDVQPLRAWAEDGVALGGLIEQRNACLAWLKARYLQ